MRSRFQYVMSFVAEPLSQMSPAQRSIRTSCVSDRNRSQHVSGNDRMGVGGTGADIFQCETGLIVQDSFRRNPLGQQTQDHFHRNPNISNYRLPTEHIRPGGDPGEQFVNGLSLPSPGAHMASWFN